LQFRKQSNVIWELD